MRDDISNPKAKSVSPGGGVKCKTKFKIKHISVKFSLEHTKGSVSLVDKEEKWWNVT